MLIKYFRNLRYFRNFSMKGKQLAVEFDNKVKTSENNQEEEKIPTKRKSDAKEILGKGPKDWETMWDLIMEMRSKHIAPVDTMGSDKLGEKKASKNEYAYHTLIGLMLSSQTKDEMTAKAMKKLKEYGLTIDNILETDEK